jgi:hypothetical protein
VQPRIQGVDRPYRLDFLLLFGPERQGSADDDEQLSR